MASIIQRGSVRSNVHGNFRCINKKPPVPKQKVVFAEHPIEVAVENQPTLVENQSNIETSVENPLETEPKLESWKAKREKKKARVE